MNMIEINLKSYEKSKALCSIRNTCLSEECKINCVKLQ